MLSKKRLRWHRALPVPNEQTSLTFHGQYQATTTYPKPRVCLRHLQPSTPNGRRSVFIGELGLNPTDGDQFVVAP